MWNDSYVHIVSPDHGLWTLSFGSIVTEFVVFSNERKESIFYLGLRFSVSDLTTEESVGKVLLFRDRNTRRWESLTEGDSSSDVPVLCDDVEVGNTGVRTVVLPRSSRSPPWRVYSVVKFFRNGLRRGLLKLNVE